MISYLKGNVILIEKDSITINVNNVGYHVLMPLPYQHKIDSELIVYVYTHVKEDQLSLFGFLCLEEKNMFLKLISVKGVGPKTALNMLASIDYMKLSEAINDENITLIKKLPGIGAKSAAQIVLDLKGKLVIEESKLNRELDDAIEALIALGYKSNDIKKIEAKLKVEDLKTEEYIKLALQLLLK